MHGLVAPETSSEIADIKSWISAGITISGTGRDSVFRHYSISGTTLIPRPSRTRDVVTIAEVGSKRLTSIDCVTSLRVSDRFRLEVDSLGRPPRPVLPDGAVSMTFLPKMLLTDNRKMPDDSGNDLRRNRPIPVPQYSAENSITSRLLKKPKPFLDIFLANVHQRRQWRQLERVPRALGAEESPSRDKFRERMFSSSRDIG